MPRKREIIVYLYDFLQTFGSYCSMSLLCIPGPWVGLWSVIVVFPVNSGQLVPTLQDINHAVRLHVQGHAVWTLVSATCFPVQGMGSGLLLCTDCHNKYVMPILNGT